MSEMQSSKRRIQYSIVLLIMGIITAIAAWNATVAVPVAQALSGEKGATTIVYRRWLISPNEIVFDVWNMDGQQSMADIDRRLFTAAEALKDRSYSSVVLAHHGQQKFLMDGAFFKEIGETRTTQNPLYTLGHMPENTRNIDGSPAFETWSGGLLAVALKRMQDNSDLHQRWWINDEAEAMIAASASS